MKTPGIAVVVVAAAFGALAFAFANRSLASDEVWSCRVAAHSSCAQWTNSRLSDSRDSSCRAMGGVVAREPCPTDEAVGMCIGSAEARVLYYSPRVPDVERISCAKLGGTWR